MKNLTPDFLADLSCKVEDLIALEVGAALALSLDHFRASPNLTCSMP